MIGRKWTVCFILAACLLSSCGLTPENERESNRPVNDVVAEHTINDRYVLIETQAEGYAPRFDLFDQEENKVYNLPTMPEFVELEQIVNENYIIFRSTGKNSETATVSAPKLVKCFRTNESDPAFERVEEPVQLDLTESLNIGTDGVTNSANILVGIGLTDVQAVFQADEEALAATGGIQTVPQTAVFFDQEENALVIKSECSKDVDILLTGTDALDYSPYIKDCLVHETDDGCEIRVYVKEEVSGYIAELKQDGLSSVRISFA